MLEFTFKKTSLYDETRDDITGIEFMKKMGIGTRNTGSEFIKK